MLVTSTAEVVLPETILKADYAQILICSNGFFNVRKNFKWGYIDSQGKELTSFKYDCPADFEGGFALVRYNREFFYLDENGTESTI
ncbi:MAG: WG repeat-containing protein [Clostridia bacterium]|nr:WG repeat-containing protein [Clostridia bacterium]